MRDRKEKLFTDSGITKEVLNSSAKFAELLMANHVYPPIKISPATGKETYASLRGMGRKAPWIAVPVVIFMVSLTGLPPTVGFPAKYALFKAALEAESMNLGWLALCLALNSVVSLYYYLRVVKELFLVESDEPAPAPQHSMATILVVLAVLTTLFGLWFTPLTEWASQSMDFLAKAG